MHNDIEQRKKQLIAEGTVYRALVVQAKNDAYAGMRPDLLVKGAIEHAASTVLAAFRNGNVVNMVGDHLPTILPLVVTGISALRKLSLPKPVIRGLLLAVVAGAVGTLVFKKMRARKRPS
jgi:hypothetical protein